MSEEQKAPETQAEKRLSFSEDPDIVAFQYAHETNGGAKIIEPLRLGKKGIEMGLTASTVNAGIADKSLIGFALPKGGCVIKLSTGIRESATPAPVA